MQKLTAKIISMALLGLVAFLGFTFLAPGEVLAVVGDVSFTGGGFGPQTITITNEETQETARGDRQITGGGIYIPLGNRKWPSGSKYSITFTDPNTGKPVTARGVTLRDGRNEINLDTLLATAGSAGTAGAGRSSGQTPYSVFDVHVGMRFFDIPNIGTSLGLRADYSPPMVFNEENFSLRPYGSIWGVPAVTISDRKIYDFNHVRQKRVDSGSMFGLNVGLKHVSDMGRWGMTLPDASVTGVLMAGIGFVHYDFDMKETDFHPNNINAKNFNSSDTAFRMEFNAGLAVNRDNYFVGVKGGVAPTVTDIFNGGYKLRWEGNLSLVGGLRF